MKFDADKHHRHSIRLPHHDYASDGAYFVTICAYRHAMLFGDIVTSNVRLNALGQLVYEEWQRTSEVRPYVTLDAFVIMPNHIHGILFLQHDETVGVTRRVTQKRASHRLAPTERPTGPEPGSLGAILAQFKSITTKRINRLRHMSATKVWQRNYYEHVIRDETDLNIKRNYVLTNPSRWSEDQYYQKALYT